MSLIHGAKYCRMWGSTTDAKITWNSIPFIPTRIVVHYFTNYSIDDYNMNWDGNWNSNLPLSMSSITGYPDPKGIFTKSTYFLQFNNGNSSRDLYIYKISWDGGELSAESGVISGANAALVTYP